MPTRGRPDYVKRAIESALAQSFSKFELIVLDNSSKVDKELILDFANSDSRIVFIDRGNIGVTEARKLGAMRARGKLLALLDSDDYWANQRLEKHLEIWRKNQIGLSWDRWVKVDKNGIRPVAQPFSAGLILPPKLALKLYFGNFIHASAGIVSTVFAKTLGFPLPEVMSSDWTLFLRAAEYYPAYFIGETLSFDEEGSPDRVSDALPEGFLQKQDLMVRRWALLSKPSIYGMGYLKGRLLRTPRRVGLKPKTTP